MITTLLVFFPENAEEIRSLAEKVFATEVIDADSKEELSPFDVVENCPIAHFELADHMAKQDTKEAQAKRYFH